MSARKTTQPSPSASESITGHDGTTMWSSSRIRSQKKRMLRIIQQDPVAAVQLVRESFKSTNAMEFDASEVHIALLKVFTDDEVCCVEVISSLLDAGMLSFLRDYIAGPAILVIPQEDSDIQAIGAPQLFNGFLAAAAKLDSRRLLSEIIDELHHEPWASLWDSRAIIIRSDFKDDMLQFLACSGIILSVIYKNCDQKDMGSANRLIDLMFFAWFHLEDSQAETLHAANAMSRYILDGPLPVLRWPGSVAADGELVSSLVSEYGPRELVRRIRSALGRMTEHFRDDGDAQNQEWSYYMLLMTTMLLPGICCHTKCRRFLMKYDILSAIEGHTSVHPAQHHCWSASASIMLAIEEHHRKPDGTPGTYETVEPQVFGRIVMMGMFYIYAEGNSSLPEEGNSKLLVELFRRHPASSAPSRMHYGFWSRTKPTLWYTCLLGLRAAAYREHGKPSYQDIQFLEQSWIEWGEKAKIDENSARLQHEAERVRICYSLSCPLGRKLQDRALLVCRGCGEARYCDKVCQKRGWKEGHRESCRRLPAP